MSDALPLTLAATSSICPRCNTLHNGRFYGPWEDCRVQMKATRGNEARDVDVAEYVQKMNVTPNAVATKDD